MSAQHERYLFYVMAGEGAPRTAPICVVLERKPRPVARSAGAHTFVVPVWQLADPVARAQVGLAGGFLLEGEGEHGAPFHQVGRWMCNTVDGLHLRHAGGGAPRGLVRRADPDDGWLRAIRGASSGRGRGLAAKVNARREDVSSPWHQRPACAPAGDAARAN